METQSLTKKCPYCAETINFEAVKCKHCGELLDYSLRASRSQHTTQIIMPEQRVRKWSRGVAALLSLIIPGAGQMYKGNVVAGFFWLIFVVIGYALFILPGIILHLICIFAATAGDPYR